MMLIMGDFSGVFTALITATAMLVGIFLKERYYPKKQRQELTIIKSTNYIELDKIAFYIRRATKAQGVYIAYFHNGGTFINGVKMDKYTVVGEDYDACLKSYKNQYKEVLVNNFAYLFHNLLVQNRHFIPNVDIDKSHDNSYKDDLRQRGIKSSYTFLIKNPSTSHPIGLVSLEFNKIDGFNTYDEKFIWKYHNNIANVLNMNINKN